MSELSEALKRIRNERGLSQAGLAARLLVSRPLVALWETTRQIPNEEQVRALDAALSARGELIGIAHLDAIDARDAVPEETRDLLARLKSADVAPPTLERLEATAFELCCRYPVAPAAELRREAQAVIRHAAGLLRRPTGLREHRELLAQAGWLALLIACLEYDLGMSRAAEATRTVARELADEAGHGEIIAWSHEIGAWMALTNGRLDDVVAESRMGIAAAPNGSGAVQLHAQGAKALARIGDMAAVREALDNGRAVLDRRPDPHRLEHHFVVDPAKYQFYAMDVYRLAGDDARAAEYAREVLRLGTRPDGSEASPMRMSEARFTLGIAEARKGNLEGAHEYGIAALNGTRRSLPTMLMVGSELEDEMRRLFPGSGLADDLGERLRHVRES